MARPPLNEEYHKLRRTRRTEAVNRESTAIAGKPKKPKTLKGVAADKWDELVKLLRQRGTLTKLDGPQIELACITYARWQALLADIETHGEIIEQTYVGQGGTEYSKRVANPASKLATQLQNSYHAQLKELGATPVAREKAIPAKRKPEKQPVDEGNPFGIVYE